jgi:4-amino-4-deoxy-L-arabinose transferase-like glycosyltransferase
MFFLGLGDRAIWIPLEARYALVAREMWEGGDWILPHLGGMVYPDKPPLLFWSIALVSSLGAGVNEWTARVPAALAAIGVCLWIWRLGSRLFSQAAGTIAALVLATSAGFFWSGRQALPDMLLTLWTTGACWGFWTWLNARHRTGAIVAGLCMGLATLAKGPVGLLLPLLAATSYLVMQRRWAGVRGREAMLCLGAILVTTLPWYLPAVQRGGLSYVQATLMHHTLERYVRAWEHTAPWYFYGWAFPAEFLPWTVFLPHAFMLAPKRARSEHHQGWWFAVCWLAAVLLFFSLSTGKRDIYILPAFPAAALLVGRVWAHWWQEVRTPKGTWAMRLPVLLIALGLLGLAGSLWMLPAGDLASRNRLLLPTTPDTRLWTCVLLSLGGIALASLAVLQRPRLALGGVIGCTWLAMLLGVSLIYTPQFNREYPIKAFAHAVRNALDPEKPLRACGPMNDLALRFQLGRFIPLLPRESDVAHYLGGNEPVYCILDLRSYQRLQGATGRQLTVLVRQELAHSALLLISNQP